MAKRSASKKAARKKPAAAKKMPAAKKPAAARPMVPRRADFGAPIEGFFKNQPSNLRAILEELRGLVEEAAPDATSSIKWGMPFYTLGRGMMCALAGFKSHVNLILAGPPGAFADPEGMLEGDAKGGRHLKLRSLDELPHDAVRGWLATAAKHAREKR